VHEYHLIEGDVRISPTRAVETFSRMPVGLNVLTAPDGRGLSCAAFRTAGKPPVSGPCLNQEVRTLMTVVAMGAAHNQKIIVPTPVVAG
jgi:hypothetical protein